MAIAHIGRASAPGPNIVDVIVIAAVVGIVAVTVVHTTISALTVATHRLTHVVTPVQSMRHT